MNRMIVGIICVLVSLAIASTAAPIWTHHQPGNPPLVLAALPDITGDAIPEIAVGYDSGILGCLASGKDAPPRILWSAPLGSTVIALMPAGDANADGVADVIASTERGRVVCVSGGGGTAGAMLWEIDAVFNISTLALMDDVTGDGIPEIAYGGADHRVTLASGKDGRILWSRFFERINDFTFIDTFVNAGDLNGDGISDLAVRTWGANRWGISGADGSDLWPPKPGDPYLSTIAAARDLTGDGANEFIESGNNGRLLLHNGRDGVEIWRCELGRPVRAIAVVDDVTGDGRFDVIAGNAAGQVACVSGASTATATAQWTTELGDLCRAIVPLGDLNQDGKPDIAAAAENGVVTAISGGDGAILWRWQGGDTVRALVNAGDHDADGFADVAAALLDGSLVMLPGHPAKHEAPAIIAKPDSKPMIPGERKRPAPSAAPIHEVPVLLYHDVPPAGLRPGDSSPLQNFRDHMDWLVKAGYNAVTLDEVADWVEGKAALPPKPVCITFDGQYASHTTHLERELAERGLFGYSYITTDWIGTANHLDWHQLRRLERSGVMEIENHSYNHPGFPGVSREEVIRQIAISNEAIARHLDGKVSRHHAYPHGFNNAAVREVMREQEFRTVTAVYDRKALRGDSRYAIPRLTVTETMAIPAFITMMEPAASPYPRLPYEYAGTVGEGWRAPSYGDVDAEGRLWVCDYAAAHVRVFLPDGSEAPFSPINKGMKQNGDVIEMRAPSGLAITPGGEALVTIAARFGANPHTGIFRYDAASGDMRPGIDVAYTPGDLDTDTKGMIYVVDKITEQWHVYAPDGREVAGSPIGQDNGFFIQRGIAVSPDGARVYIISEQAGTLAMWEGRATPEGAQFERRNNLVNDLSFQSGGVDVMPDGTVLAGYHIEGFILAFDKAGRIIGQISGGGPPSLRGPRGTAFTPDGRHLWVFSLFGEVQHWTKPDNPN